MGVLGFYFSLFLISKLIPSKPKPVVEAAVATTSQGDVPSVEDPAFGEWISAPGNIEKMFA
jgi:hypothetical protein